MAGKEVAEFENAARRMHVFGGGDARNRRFVHFHGLGDVLQDERFHRFLAQFEKTRLPLHDAARHLDQGLVANLEAAHQPARLLQLSAQHGVVGGARNQVRVSVVDPDPRHRRLIDFDDPAVLGAAHEHVRDHVFRLRRVDRRPRPRMAGAHQRQRHLQIAFAAAHLPAQQDQLLAGDQVEVFQCDANRDVPRRRVRMQLPQLQRNALAQVAGADPGRFQRLDGAQDTLDVRRGGLDLRQKAHADIFQFVLEVAVVGDGIGDDARDGHVDGGQLGEFQLFDELFLQGLTMLVAEIAAAVVIAGPGSIRRTAGLLSPGLVRDLHLGFFALLGGSVVAVQFGVFLFDGQVFALARVFAQHRFAQRLRRLFFGLEHHIGLERLADMRLQIERGQLQQPDGLLQLRRHGELLADAKLQTGLQHSSFRSEPTV